MKLDKIEGVADFILKHWPLHQAPPRGASSEDLARLTSAQGRPLPADYLAFLERMGHGTEGLRWEHIDFRVAPILNVLTRPRKSRFVPRRYLLIGRDLTESTLEFLLDLEAGSEDGTAVVRSVYTMTEDLASEDVQPDATCLSEMVFREAFLVLRRYSLPYASLHASTDFTGKPQEKNQVEAVLAGLGLTRHPLSGPWFQAYESREGLIAVRWLEGEVLQLITASEENDWVAKMGKELRHRLPVRLT